MKTAIIGNHFKTVWTWICAVCICHMASAQAPDPDPARDRPPVRFALIITGNELLKGVYADLHTQFLTQTLTPLGMECVVSISVGDSELPFLDALEYADDHSEVVIVTGGLGPTPADITRETVSKYTGIPIELNHELLEAMTKRFNTPKDQLRSNLKRQCYTPLHGSYLKNEVGSAYGLIFANPDHPDLDTVICLPGPPGELQHITRTQLIPYLSERFGIRTTGESMRLRFVGIGESSLDHTIQTRITLPEDVITEYKFDMNRVDITFSLSAHSPTHPASLQQLKHDLLQYVQEYFYTEGDSTLESHVLQLLKQHGENLAVAEIGSGGAVSAALSDAPENKDIYVGGLIAPNRESMRRLLRMPPDSTPPIDVHPHLTDTFAEQICKTIGSEWAIAVSDIQTDGNSRFVLVTTGSEADGFQTQRHNLRGRGESAQKRLVTDILDQLRKQLNH